MDIIASLKELLALHPILCIIMGVAFISFLISFVFAIFSYENHRSSNTLKFAPSVMTSLGLFGTFISLISSLNGLGGSINENQIDINGIAGFMASLEKVFYFSAMGILSAVIFLFLNIAVTQKNAKNSREEKKTIIGASHELDSSRNEELEKQTQNLELIRDFSKKKLIANKQEFERLNQTMMTMNGSLQKMQQGHDMDLLGAVISAKLSETMQPSFDRMIQALQHNNSDTIHQLLGDLKTEILLPIKYEIAKTTESTNQVVAVIQKNQQINIALIKKLGEMTTSMDSFVEKTQTLANDMAKTIEDLAIFQGNQDKILGDFNKSLSINLNKIEPSIKRSMSFATEQMSGAINKVTDDMNTAMTGVITDISNKVVDELGKTLTQFDTNMDGHLTRMNTELEKTGTNAKELIDKSANALEQTLGEIDQTLDKSSEKLQNELEAFRNEYEVSLTQFFTEQNEQLEKTLGLQAQALQETAEQLKTQFKNMTEQQTDINHKSKTLLDNFKPTYDSLLSQMASIAQNLHNGQNKLTKDLQSMQEHTQTINAELEKLGQTMPTEFTKAFELLNKMYIDKFNQSNEMLEKAMKEMTVAAAALITTSNFNQSSNE